MVGLHGHVAAFVPNQILVVRREERHRPDWDLTGTVANVRLLFSIALSLSNSADFLR